jgi:hypothetical protein
MKRYIAELLELVRFRDNFSIFSRLKTKSQNPLFDRKGHFRWQQFEKLETLIKSEIEIVKQ